MICNQNEKFVGVVSIILNTCAYYNLGLISGWDGNARDRSKSDDVVSSWSEIFISILAQKNDFQNSMMNQSDKSWLYHRSR
jgi:hypothetical protein